MELRSTATGRGGSLHPSLAPNPRAPRREVQLLDESTDPPTGPGAQTPLFRRLLGWAPRQTSQPSSPFASSSGQRSADRRSEATETLVSPAVDTGLRPQVGRPHPGFPSAGLTRSLPTQPRTFMPAPVSG